MSHFVVIGLGSIGRRHATNLAQLEPNARFTFVRRRGGQSDLGVELGARVVSTLDQIDEPVDLAVLATPSANHVDDLPTLIDNGWPLVVEKPVVTSRQQAAELREALASSPAAVRVAGFNLRYLPSLRRIQSLVAAGELGTVVRASFIAGQWLPDWRPAVDYRSVYSADAALGGGVELDLSHEFDVARWFFGDLAVEFARCGHFSNLELQASDTAVAVLGRPGPGAPVITVSLDYVSRQRVRWYEVVGDEGRIEWSLDGRLDLSRSDGTRSIVEADDDFDVGQTYIAMMRSVLHAVRTGDESFVQRLDDGLVSTELALDVRDLGVRP